MNDHLIDSRRDHAIENFNYLNYFDYLQPGKAYNP